MLKIAWAIGTGLFLATAAMAETTVQQAKSPDQNLKDANEVVCQREETIGSRLAAKKICLTRKEWDERARINREETERAQQNTANPNGL